MSMLYDIPLRTIEGPETSLAEYKDAVLLIVNVASQCGLTPQYAGLQKIYEHYIDSGFVVLGFPCNDFGAQEPGTNEEIKTFCTRKYNVQFPMMSTVSVKGSDITPLYQYLTDSTVNPTTGGEIKWNFTKFLFDRNGNVVARFEPEVTPDSPQVVGAIEKALGN